MPPKSSKRTRHPPPATPLNVDLSAVEAMISPWSSITTLSADILLEIISYFQSVPMSHHPTDPSADFHLPPDIALERQDALRSLSQTCHSFRDLFLPLLWENVELAGIRSGAGPWHKQCQSTLLARCEGLAGNHDLARHVRGIRFVLSAATVATSLEALVKGINACTHLQTIYLWFASASSKKGIQDAGLEKYTFPSVERVIGPDLATHFLVCCPNVEEIGGLTNGAALVKSMQTTCKQVEVLTRFSGEALNLKKLVTLAPNLRELRFDSFPSPEDCEILGGFKYLRTIEMRTEFMGEEEDDIEEHFQGQLAVLRRVLPGCSVTMRGYFLHYCNFVMARTVHI